MFLRKSSGFEIAFAFGIDSAADPIGPTPELVAEDNNVAQRNIQVGTDTAFDVRNPGGAAAGVGVEFRGNGFPVSAPGVAELSVQYHPALAAAWAGVPQTTLVHDTVSDRLVVTFRGGRIRLPDAVLPAGTRLPASVRLVLRPEVFGTFTVDFSEYVSGTLRGGMSFSVTGQVVPD